MGVGYGSNITPEQLASGRIGRLDKPKRDESFIEFVRILTTIIEISVAFSGIGALAETAVALGAGAINEALDIQTGHATLVGGALNLVVPFIGGGFAALNNFANVEKFAARASTLKRQIMNAEIIKGVSSPYWEMMNEILRPMSLGVKKSKRGLDFWWDVSEFTRFNKGVKGYTDTIVSRAKLLGKESTWGDYAAYGYNTIGAYEKIGARINKIAEKGLFAGDNAVKDIFEDRNITDTLRKSGLSDEIIRQWQRVIRRARNNREASSILLGLIRSLGDADAIKLYRNLSQKIEVVLLNQANQLPFALELQNQLRKNAIKLEKAVQGQKETMLKSFWRKVNSAEFNDKVVQKLQLVDPNDLGRAPVEATYQKLRKQIANFLRVEKKADSIEDAFVKSGGVLVDSEWIMGYKLVHEFMPGKYLVMINFKYQETYGKKPVFVIATMVEIERFVLNPGRYYLNTWAYSKGGKKLGLGNLFGSGKQINKILKSSVLPFIPVQGLKNIISIVSNWTENIADMVSGDYKENYFEKLVKSLKNTAISRSFRLLGRAVGGGIAERYLGRRLGQFIGAELQRLGTNVFAQGVKNVLAGKEFGEDVGKRIAKGGLISIRSNLLKGLRRRNRYSVVANTLSARRKIQVVKRIPNAVMPGRPFKGIPLKRFQK